MIESDAGKFVDPNSSRDETRTRIVAAAIVLLDRGGRNAVTTRAVSEAAGVQAPAIYRLFQDMSGLLDAVADYGFSTYMKEKKLRKLGDDPVEDLRIGWDLHVEFGLAHPAIYKLMYCDPQPGIKSPAAANSYRVLGEHIHRIAVVGRLCVSEEKAADLVHAAGCGMVLTLLSMPRERRDMETAAIARDAMITAITTESPVIEGFGPAAAAVALRAILPEAVSLSDGERALLGEWLDRLVKDNR